MLALIYLQNTMEIGSVSSLLEENNISFYTTQETYNPLPENNGATLFVNQQDLEKAQEIVKAHLPFLTDNLLQYKAISIHPPQYENKETNFEHEEFINTKDEDSEFENRFNYTFERLHPINREENTVEPTPEIQYKQIPNNPPNADSPFVGSVVFRFLAGAGISFVIYIFKNCN